MKLQNGGGQAGWRDVLENNQRAFAQAWTQRQDFKSVFDGKSNSEYVLTLLANAGLPPTNAASLTADLDARAQNARAALARHR